MQLRRGSRLAPSPLGGLRVVSRRERARNQPGPCDAQKDARGKAFVPADDGILDEAAYDSDCHRSIRDPARMSYWERETAEKMPGGQWPPGLSVAPDAAATERADADEHALVDAFGKLFCSSASPPDQ